jgi:hypothetical protein
MVGLNGLGYAFLVETCTHVHLTDCDGGYAGNDCLNFFDTCDSCSVKGGRWYGAFPRDAGPLPAGIEVADGSTNILIEDVECDHNQGAGITIHSHAATEMPRNVTVRRANCHDNTTASGRGIIIFNQNDTVDTGADLGIVLEDCVTDNNEVEGLRITKSAGITEYPAGITIDNHTSRNNTTYGLWLEGDDVTIRRFLSVGGRGITIRDAQNIALYHPTIYLPAYAGYNPIGINSAGTNRTSGVTVRNGIIQVDGATTAPLVAVTASNTTGVSIDYMLYYTATGAAIRWQWAGVTYATLALWKAGSGQDANSPDAADPLFTDVSGGVFTVSASSPAIDEGLSVVGVNENYLGTAPDLGFYPDDEAVSLLAGHTHDDRYYTEAESDALYAALAHTHDDRYYTEAETDALIADFITQAEGDARYGQLGALNTWALAQTFTGQVLAAPGLVGTPGIAFSADPDTGIFNTADSLLFSTGGTQRLSMSSTAIIASAPIRGTISSAVTNSTTLVADWRHNTSGTPANGLGIQQIFRTETDTTIDTTMGTENFFWSTITHASRTSTWLLQAVYNGGANYNALQAKRTGVAGSTALWLWDEDNGTLEQVTVGAADSGGAGFKVLRIPN